MTPLADTNIPSFDVDALTNRIRSAQASTFVISGLSSRAVANSLTQLRKSLAEAGIGLVVFDPRSRNAAERSLQRCVSDFMARIEAERGIDPQLLRLAETIDRTAERSGGIYVDTLARLWTELVRDRPTLFVVLDVVEADAEDHAALQHFARFVYNDPLAQLTPEAKAWERPEGAMLFAGACDFDVEGSVTIDFSADALASIRDYLSREDVAQKILESTAGDLTRLGAVVDSLPERAHHLALYRFDALAPRERTVIEVLGVAGQLVTPDVLHDALALTDGAEFFAKSLRSLEDAGFVRKTMGAGRILVGLEDQQLGGTLVARMSAERSTAIHRSLADAERVRNEADPDVEFLARHYIAAGESELALEFGSDAVARLCSRREYAKAKVLLEQIVSLAPDDRRPGYEAQLAAVLENLGEFQQALEACARAGDAPDVLLRRARILARTGKYDAALQAFEVAAQSGVAAIVRDAVIGRADAAYALGLHDEAIEALQGLLSGLAEDDVEASVRDRAVLAARNTLGKIAMVRSEATAAVDFFEANRELAARWGWDEEVARAQANLGVAALQRDDYAVALERLEQALTESGTRGSLPRAYCLGNLAAVHQRRGDFGQALDHCLESMRCARKAGDQSAYTIAARNLATIYQDLGAYDRAWTIVDHLREEYEESVGTLAGGWNLFVRGHLHQETGEIAKALDAFEALLEGGTRAVFETQTLVRLAEIHFELGHETRARELLREVEGSVDSRAKYRALWDLLDARMRLKEEPERAMKIARNAHKALVEAGTKNEPVRAQLVVAEALTALGRDAEARTELQRALGRLREVARLVPDPFRSQFWSKPLHAELVKRLQAVDGEVPDECIPVSETTATTEVTRPDRGSPEFVQWRQRYEEIVGEDPRLHHVFRVVDRVAAADASVLVYGESGTGKELVAGALHRRSNRTGKPFVKINCAAFVENLLLSELFGHEKGAFTGASEQKIGRFELADGGTIFLDEIGDISPNTQVALLRVLQEGTFERVGGNQTRQVDVRVVCATNKNLEEMVRRGEFRLDLYYRLKGVVIEMPPLRERREDIARLARHFAVHYSGDRPKHFSNPALQFLASYSWPGNVRELQNFVRSALLFVDDSVVKMTDIEDFRDFFVSGTIDESLPAIRIDDETSVPAAQVLDSDTTTNWLAMDPEDALVESIVAEGRSLSDIKKKLETECIRRALIETGGNVTQAADILQMKRPRLSQIINGDPDLSELKNRLAG